METRPRVLLMGLEGDTAHRIAAELEARGCACEVCTRPGEALFRANWVTPHMVVLDQRDDSGLGDIVVESLESSPDVPVIGIDAHPSIDALAWLAGASATRHADESSRPTRVLVVDDDVDLREALGTHLRLSGFEMVEARDGHEALECLERERPDVILLDLMMPRLSGIGLLQRLGADAPPIVIYTAYLDPTGRDYPNVAAVLRKPAPFERLAAALRSSARKPRSSS